MKVKVMLCIIMIVILLLYIGYIIVGKSSYNSGNKLFIACKNGDIGVIMAADVTQLKVKDNMGNTLLSTSIQYHQDVISLYLIENGVSLDSENSFGERPIDIALKENRITTVAILLVNGVDPETINGAGNIAMEYVKSDEAIKLLKRYGANINYLYTDKLTPLFIAVIIGNTKLVKLLINNGANINITNQFNETLLDVTNDDEIKQILIEAGAKS